MFVGIDFGTTNSAIGVADACGDVQLVPLDPGHASYWRTVLYFEPGGGLSAGAPAIARYLETEGEGRLVQSIKSHLASAAFTRTSIFGLPFTVAAITRFGSSAKSGMPCCVSAGSARARIATPL